MKGIRIQKNAVILRIKKNLLSFITRIRRTDKSEGRNKKRKGRNEETKEQRREGMREGRR